jgi:hypothetical protein
VPKYQQGGLDEMLSAAETSDIDIVRLRVSSRSQLQLNAVGGEDFDAYTSVFHIVEACKYTPTGSEGICWHINITAKLPFLESIFNSPPTSELEEVPF